MIPGCSLTLALSFESGIRGYSSVPFLPPVRTVIRECGVKDRQFHTFEQVEPCGLGLKPLIPAPIRTPTEHDYEFRKPAVRIEHLVRSLAGWSIKGMTRQNKSTWLFRVSLCGWTAMPLCLGASLVVASAANEIDFSRDIRPILSDKCFVCHGPDAENREADLRLDVRSVAVETGAIAPGDLDGSELLARIASDDPDEVMPPPSTRKTISQAEAVLLQKWIAEGADYQEHWAFSAPERPDPPVVENEQWITNPIDRFVAARLSALDMKPSERADRTTFVRRVYLDLIGLPPSPAEVDAFLSDDQPDAHGRLVERLLDSKHFGERWGRWWLDAARYADSDGYEKDKQRSVWFYRDWVVDAMNRDMPYDQFIVEQIAGDLLPDATQSQLVATGFLRNSMVNEEGGADPEQFRVEGMFDRMDAIGKAVLGITTQCAQCHTHKYDPLSQREYYQMFAALNNFHEATATVYTTEQDEQREELLGEITAIHESIKRRMPAWESQLAAWAEQEAAKLIDWRTVVPTDRPWEGQKFRLLDDGSIISESYAPTKSNTTFRLTTTAEKITAIRLDVLTHPQLPCNGPGRSIYGTGALTEFQVSYAPADKPDEQHNIKFVRAISDVNPAKTELPAAFRDKDPEKDKRVTGSIEYALDGDSATAWSTDNGPGRRNQDRYAVFFPETPVETKGEIILSFSLQQLHGGWNSDDNQNYLLGRYRFSVTDNDSLPEKAVPSSVQAILRVPESERTAQQREELFAYWCTTVLELSEDVARIEQLWQTHPEGDTQLVAHAMSESRPTHVLKRGDFLNLGESVDVGAPEFLNPILESNEPDRLRFARWLVAEDAPTTARVIVNRLWQSYFGQGIVTTPEDFGFQSAPPTHPQLIDWLAVELMENGWSLKHIHRLIATSSTYQQSSKISAPLFEADPSNKWLARGPRLRVDAEIVRDIALCSSGLLNEEIGGPAVYPPAPEFLFLPPASYGPKNWRLSGDGEQYRRSLYVHRYRSVPYPSMELFDAPKGDAACVRRQRSNTPLQALVMLNEPQFVECARAMAERVVREGGESDNQRLEFAHRLCVSRQPTSEELVILQKLLGQQRERIATGEINLEELLSTSAVEDNIDTEMLAPWVVVCRAILNLDETITKQ